MSDVSPTSTPVHATVYGEFMDFVNWCRQNPVAMALGIALVATLAFFFGALHLFVNNSETAAVWAWLAWNPEQNQEHSKLVPLISLYLAWCHRDEILKAKKQGAPLGLAFVFAGVFLFLLSARCLQPRMAQMALPFLLYGSILYVWGKEVARLLFFPCAFLIFLIPFGVVEQATFKLQFVITGIVGALANLVGISIHAVGTTLAASNSSFHFEVAEGCSGIRSITALAMLSSVYAHLTQDALWKKIVLVGCSALFAIIGNVGRIFTILLVAKWFNADLAGGKYHEISGYLIFPFAIAAMVGTARLLNLDFKKIAATTPALQNKPQPPGHDGGSYDY